MPKSCHSLSGDYAGLHRSRASASDHDVLNEKMIDVEQGGDEMLRKPPGRRRTPWPVWLLALGLIYYVYKPLFISPTTNTIRHGSSSPQLLSPIQRAKLVSYHTRFPEASKHVAKVKRWWAPWARAIRDASPSIQKVNVTEALELAQNADRFAPRRPNRSVLNMTNADRQNLRQTHQRFISYINNYRRYKHDVDELFHGRGIVMVAGGEFNQVATITLAMVRDKSKDIPVELFFPTWDDYSPELCEDYFATQKVTCLVISDFLSEIGPERLKGYQFKSFALMFSSFRDVLLLDSDSIPLVDPDTFFKISSYKQTGMVTWPDFWSSTEAPEFWTDIAGLSSYPQDMAPMSPESGQMLVDKSRHLPTFMLALYYNTYGPGVYYTLLSQGALGEGDKTTFEAAADVLKDMKYYRVHQTIEATGVFVQMDSGMEFRSTGMLQRFPEELPADLTNGFALHGGQITVDARTPFAFYHANRPKLSVSNLVDNEPVTTMFGEKTRFLGRRDLQMQKFGEDLEQRIWGHLQVQACETSRFFEELSKIEDVCDKTKAHMKDLFEDDALVTA